MGGGANGNVVVAGLKDVGTLAVCVVARKLGLVDLNRQGLGLAGLKELGLGKAHKLDRGLLDTIGLVVVGVGALRVGLDDVLAGHRADVGDLDGQGDLSVLLGAVGQLLLKAGVGQAVAKRELNLVCIAPGRAGGRAGGGVGVALTQDDVLVAGLVVAIPDVDTLLVDHVGVVGLAGHGVHAKVLDGRGRRRVVGVGVHGLTRGVHGARKNVTHGEKTVLARVANPQAGIDAVLLLVKEAQVHGVARVDKHDDLVEVLRDVAQQLLLVGGELKIAAAHVLGRVKRVGVERASVALDVHGLKVGLVISHRQIRALGARAGKRHDGGVAVVGKARGLGVAEHRGRGLVNHITTRAGDVGHVHTNVLGSAGGVEVPHGGVDVEASGLQGGLERRRRSGVHGTRATAAIEDVGRAHTKQRHVAAGQRQRGGIVLKQDKTLARRLLGGLCVGRKTLGLSRVLGFVILGVLVRALVTHLVALLPQERGYHGGVLVGIVVANNKANGDDGDKHQRNDRPCFLHLLHFSLPFFHTARQLPYA